MGFYFDQTRCIGCYACSVSCKDWHNVDPGPAHWRKVITLEEGKFPDVQVAFLSSACYHCASPACVTACPAEAIRKRERDGIVVVDREKCLGKDDCGACREACPYEAPQFGAEENAKMQKCDLCLDRIGKGEKPVCVAACRTRALAAGPMDELEAKFGGGKEAPGMTHSPRVKPSAIFKRKEWK